MAEFIDIIGLCTDPIGICPDPITPYPCVDHFYSPSLPCPLLSGNTMQGGNTFIRSEFDYAIRQRKQYCPNYSVGFSFIMESKLQMKEWKDFYYTILNNGVDTFGAEWEVEGIEGWKEFRFNNIYSTVALGNNIYQVSAGFDMITKIKDI